MKKQVLLTCVGAIVVILVLAGIKALQIKSAIAEGEKHKPPPDTVSTMTIKETQWQNDLSIVGAIAPTQGVTIKSEESGRVVKIGFVSGQLINKGDLIIELDTSVESANLNKAQAMEERTKLGYERAKNLRSSNAVSQDELENWRAQNAQAIAEVRSLSATINKKIIRAPFSGTIGIRMIQEGQFLNPGTEIVSLQNLDNLFLNFSLPQQYLSKIKIGQTISFEVDAYKGQQFAAKVSAIDSVVDQMTRNFAVQATAENVDKKLRAGMYASLRLNIGEPQNVIAIPLTSISFAPYGNSVFLVTQGKNEKGEDALVATSQFVELGQRKGDFAVVLKGLSVGQQIVITGVFKVRPGAEIFINNDLLPQIKLDPNPEDT